MYRIAAVVLLGLTGAAHATCYGTQNNQTCYDPNTGNSYSVQRYGSQTHVQGHSASTGTNWSQDSMTIGNSTYTNGQAANGQRWNETQTHIGNTVTTYGTNAAGKPFSDYRYVPSNGDE